MFQSYRIFVWVTAIGVTMALNGCGSPASQENQKQKTSTESKTQQKPAAQGEHAGHEGHELDANHGEHSGHGEQDAHDNHANAASADATKGLADLSEDDRVAAEKQRVCPVSGDVLGTAGKPYKVTAKGQTIFLCCPDCEKSFMKNPDKYLAKIEADKPK